MSFGDASSDIMIRFQPNTSSTDETAIFNAMGVTPVESYTIVPDLWAVNLNTGVDLNTALSVASNYAAVMYAEPNSIVTVASDTSDQSQSGTNTSNDTGSTDTLASDTDIDNINAQFQSQISDQSQSGTNTSDTGTSDQSQSGTNTSDTGTSDQSQSGTTTSDAGTSDQSQSGTNEIENINELIQIYDTLQKNNVSQDQLKALLADNNTDDNTTEALLQVYDTLKQNNISPDQLKAQLAAETTNTSDSSGINQDTANVFTNADNQLQAALAISAPAGENSIPISTVLLDSNGNPISSNGATLPVNSGIANNGLVQALPQIQNQAPQNQASQIQNQNNQNNTGLYIFIGISGAILGTGLLFLLKRKKTTPAPVASSPVVTPVVS